MIIAFVFNIFPMSAVLEIFLDFLKNIRQQIDCSIYQVSSFLQFFYFQPHQPVQWKKPIPCDTPSTI